MCKGNSPACKDDNNTNYKHCIYNCKQYKITNKLNQFMTINSEKQYTNKWTKLLGYKFT